MGPSSLKKVLGYSREDKGIIFLLVSTPGILERRVLRKGSRDLVVVGKETMPTNAHHLAEVLAPL